MGSGSETASVFRMSESGYSGRMLASARGGTAGALLGGPHYYGPSGGRRGARTLAFRAPSAVRRAIAEGRQMLGVGLRATTHWRSDKFSIATIAVRWRQISRRALN